MTIHTPILSEKERVELFHRLISIMPDDILFHDRRAALWLTGNGVVFSDLARMGVNYDDAIDAARHSRIDQRGI